MSNIAITKRPRRLRSSQTIRDMVRETSLSAKHLIYPLFVVEGENIKSPIPSLPDCYHYSLDKLEDEIKELKSLGLNSVLLFGLPKYKDEQASSAYENDGIVQRAVKKIKEIDENFFVITDVCMCAYTSHGHCGIVSKSGIVKNDESIEILAKIALSHALAGSDMVAPSDMMDFRVGAIREKLDSNKFENVSIMAYTAKYASSYYGPFREAVSSSFKGNRKTYQMDYHNTKEAIIEAKLDIAEGADIIMVKPALAYLDIIKELRQNFDTPISAYNVSGEYTMIKNAISQNIISEEVIYETILSIKRAGADIIITYFAKDLAKMLKNI